MTHSPAKTGPGATVLMAIEQCFPAGARTSNDDLRYRIIPFSYRAYILADAVLQGVESQGIREKGLRSLGGYHGPQVLD